MQLSLWVNSTCTHDWACSTATALPSCHSAPTTFSKTSMSFTCAINSKHHRMGPHVGSWHVNFAHTTCNASPSSVTLIFATSTSRHPCWIFLLFSRVNSTHCHRRILPHYPCVQPTQNITTRNTIHMKFMHMTQTHLQRASHWSLSPLCAFVGRC